MWFWSVWWLVSTTSCRTTCGQLFKCVAANWLGILTSRWITHRVRLSRSGLSALKFHSRLIRTLNYLLQRWFTVDCEVCVFILMKCVLKFILTCFHFTEQCTYLPTCEEDWRRAAVAAAAETQRLLSPAIPGLTAQMRSSATPLGAPLILSPRMSVPTTAASILNGSGPPLLSAGDPHSILYTPYEYANYTALTAPLLATEYATADHSGGLFARWL